MKGNKTVSFDDPPGLHADEALTEPPDANDTQPCEAPCAPTTSAPPDTRKTPDESAAAAIRASIAHMARHLRPSSPSIRAVGPLASNLELLDETDINNILIYFRDLISDKLYDRLFELLTEMCYFRPRNFPRFLEREEIREFFITFVYRMVINICCTIDLEHRPPELRYYPATDEVFQQRHMLNYQQYIKDALKTSLGEEEIFEPVKIQYLWALCQSLSPHVTQFGERLCEDFVKQRSGQMYAVKLKS